MTPKTVLFLDTESTIYNNQRVIYDLSISVAECNSNSTFCDKTLRTRRVYKNGKSINILEEKNYIIYEFAHLVPSSKQTMYGYANYEYINFCDAVHMLKTICNYYKPDSIMGYNIQADYSAIKNTQSVLKTSPDIYTDKSCISSASLFKKNVCTAFDKAHKSDLMLYLTNHCPNFMKQQEEFAFENRLYTDRKYLSRRLIDMYRFATSNPNIEQMHMGYYDNMYAIACLEKSMKTDNFTYFPFDCMTQNNRKRKHSDSFKNNDRNVKIKFMMLNEPLPVWFDDQLQNSKCLENEDIEDIRKFHPHYGGTNNQSAPYFRGVHSRAGIWPPSYVNK
jgi:hypothetical protein